MTPEETAKEKLSGDDLVGYSRETARELRALAEWATAIAEGGLDWRTKHDFVFSAYFQGRVRLTGTLVEWRGGGSREDEVRGYVRALWAGAFPE